MQKIPHVEISTLAFEDIIKMTKVAFQKVTSVSYEKYKLFNRTQQAERFIDLFYAALAAQAAMSELVTLEQEFVRDLFLSRMRNARLQDAITVETLSPEEVLKRAIKQQTNNPSVTKD